MTQLRQHGLAIVGGLTILALIAVSTGAERASAASVLRVPQDYTTIQSAINAASSGDTVSVSPGVYAERIDNYSKAITIESTGGASVTAIDGGRSGTVVRLIASPGETPVLRGFTVRNGYDFSAFGGGVFTYGGPALIEDNVVSDNYSCFGGIDVNFSAAVIRNNRISGTRPNCSGGWSTGVLVLGAGTATVTGNIIEGNVGGIALFAAGTPTIGGNRITGNSGSGIDLANYSDAAIVNNLITGNSGPGISWLVPSGARGPIVGNNTIAYNSGSAIFADGFDVSTRVFNNILVGSGSQAVVNCGAFNDPNPPILEFNDVISVGSGARYGGICSDQAGTNGNISADPLFAAASDFHLQLGSPAIDAGTSVGAPTEDLEGNPRPLDGNADGLASWDMGAYEYPDTTPPDLTVSVTPNILWPPTHKYVTVTVTVTATDDTDPNPTIELVSVTSNEPDNGLGDGDTPSDIVIKPASAHSYEDTFQLRAERSGTGTGRIYTITYLASDASGNSALASATVTVPLSQK